MPNMAFFISTFFVALIFYCSGSTFITVCSSITIFQFLSFIKNLGQKFVFIELIKLIACIQWLIGPVLFSQIGLIKQDENSDFSVYIIFGTLFYIIGLSIPLIKESNISHTAIIRNLKPFNKTNEKGIKCP
jgi:hypothetical protein